MIFNKVRDRYAVSVRIYMNVRLRESSATVVTLFLSWHNRARMLIIEELGSMTY